MRMPPLAVLALAIVPGVASASAGHAQDIRMVCTFTSECVELEPCEATDYRMDVEITAGQPPFAVAASTDTETLKGNALKLESGILVQLSGAVGPLIMTVDGAGQARQSVHGRDGAMMINYAGACEALE